MVRGAEQKKALSARGLLTLADWFLVRGKSAIGFRQTTTALGDGALRDELAAYEAAAGITETLDAGLAEHHGTYSEGGEAPEQSNLYEDPLDEALAVVTSLDPAEVVFLLSELEDRPEFFVGSGYKLVKDS